MNKKIAKRLDRIADKLESLHSELSDLIEGDIDVQVENAREYADEHENSEKAQEKAEMWETTQSELQSLLDDMETLKDSLQNLYYDTLYC